MHAVDLAKWRRILVTGTDALDWLDDLISAGLSGADGSRRSLLLTPTGRIRADFHVAPSGDGYLLIQDPIQPKPIDELLAPYVLSSDVMLRNANAATSGRWENDTLTVTDSDEGAHNQDDFDAWRIREGMPRFGVDLDEESLPQEAGWERFIDFTKGCFMGQEAMARIRNFGGHPTRVVKAMRSEREVTASEPLLASEQEVGRVTSAAGLDVIVRVTWNARDAELRTAGGVALSDRA